MFGRCQSERGLQKTIEVYLILGMKKDLHKEILRLAGPNILSNISVPLLSTVDTILMGGLSSIHLGAIGIGSMIFNILYWNFGFLRMGTTGITAQQFGAGLSGEVFISLLRASVLALVIGFFLILLKGPIQDLTMGWMNVTDHAHLYVSQYFDIRIWAAPATLLLYVMMGWYFGIQNAIIPLLITIIVNVFNILFSYYFVIIQGYEVAGVAWGTVIAQYIGLLASIVFLVFKYRQYIDWSVLPVLKDAGKYRRFFMINIDLFIRTVCLTFAFGFFYSKSSESGDVVLAVNVVLMQFVNWMSYGIDGFAYACESLVGRFKGAGDRYLLYKTVHFSFWWAAGLGFVYAIVFFYFGKPLFFVFSDDEHLWSQSRTLIEYIAVFPLLGFWSYIWDGVFVGLTATRAMRDTMILALVVYLTTYYLYPDDQTGARIWISLMAFLVARAVFQYGYWKIKGIEGLI